MLVSRYKKAINAEFLLTGKENDTEQIKVTSFDPVLVNVIYMEEEESETENDLLSLKDYDMKYNKKMIVTSIVNNSNSLNLIIAVVRNFFCQF